MHVLTHTLTTGSAGEHLLYSNPILPILHPVMDCGEETKNLVLNMLLIGS
jgi:hypothetical protein